MIRAKITGEGVKVSELISALLKMPPDAHAVVYDHGDEENYPRFLCIVGAEIVMDFNVDSNEWTKPTGEVRLNTEI